MFKIFKYFKKIDWLYVLICFGLIVLQVWLELTMPDYTAKLTKAVASGSLDMGEVWANGGMMLLCAAGSMIGAILTGFFSAKIAANFSRTLREKLFGKISTFSDREINYFTTPSLITRTTNDVVQMQMLIALGMQVLIKAPILAIWAVCKISATSIEWTTATLIIVVVMVTTIGLVVGVCYPKFKKIQKLTDNLNDITRENISGVRVIRAFNADEYQAEKFEKVNKEVTSNNLFTSRTMGIMLPIMTICMSGLTLAIYWIGAILLNNQTDIPARVNVIAEMTAFTQYALQVVMAFMMLIMIFIILPRAIVSARRINEVLDTEPSIIYDGKVNAELDGEIEFKNVSFAYPDAANPCLCNLNFHIHKGETFAIIGATGTGKTTLINLIPRFFDVTEGEVLLSGINVKDLDKESIENGISLATQKAVMFKGTIKSNVAYGAKEIDEEKVKKALDIANAEFVDVMEKGIESDVAQSGTNFSGGQKQRLSIARAVYKDAKIMIFDDTFSALDYKTDMLVRKKLKQNLKDVTVIIVAQRIGTIKNADQILVLDGGKIVGLGKHEKLLKTCPVYKEIALSQLSEEEL